MIGARMLLAAVAGALGERAQNQTAWTYTIWGFDGSPYITRTLLPRVFGHRPILHRIWRPDADPWLHNHPWKTASFLIVSGGYVEERLPGKWDPTSPKLQAPETRELTPGDVNHLDADTFHRVTHVKPNTWTIGWLGERVQDWGFLVDDEFTPWREYFARKGKAPEAGKGSS